MIIELKNLSKSYGNKQALKNISLELTPGIYGLLGPNGAGKSTMMNIITGNLKQTDGDIICKGTANELTERIGDKVWEIVAAEEALPEIMKIGTVCGIAKEEDNVAVRILSEKQLDGFCTPVRPNLEDVYLYYFGTAVEL